MSRLALAATAAGTYVRPGGRPRGAELGGRGQGVLHHDPDRGGASLCEDPHGSAASVRLASKERDQPLDRGVVATAGPACWALLAAWPITRTQTPDPTDH